MRIILTIIAQAFTAVFASSCEALCTGLSECANDPHAHGSYCKVDHDPQICFGLYYSDESRTAMCFQPNNASCREDFPVQCPLTCEQRCQAVDSCRTDPHAHGSYCKVDHTPRTCFGLYFTDASETEMCFFPNDASCDESRPVGC